MRDTLFLLAPGFEGGSADMPRREYCPECAEVWGLLSYFPAIKNSLDIHYQPLARPRQQMAEMLGDKNQNCPTLVLHADSPSFENCGILQKKRASFYQQCPRYWFILCPKICQPAPRGHVRG